MTSEESYWKAELCLGNCQGTSTPPMATPPGDHRPQPAPAGDVSGQTGGLRLMAARGDEVKFTATLCIGIFTGGIFTVGIST